MRVKKKYFPYYLSMGMLMGFVVGFTPLLILLSDGLPSKNETIFFLCLFGSMGLIFGGIMYYTEEFYKPKKEKEILDDDILAGFQEIGFEKKGNYLEGKAGEYPCRIWWTSFSPGDSDYGAIVIFLSADLLDYSVGILEEKNEEYHMEWDRNGLLTFSEFGVFKKPTHFILRSQMEEAVEILKNLQLPSKDFKKDGIVELWT